MASQLPDPRTFESADDAFNYPVVNVRGIEKKLRRDVDETQEKLRTLVGASYRDLLGTAQTIVDIDGQMHQVEKVLVDIGRRSDSRLLDKLAANYLQLQRNTKAQASKDLAFAAQLAVLQNALNVITKLLRTRGSTILAAKLLVTARLLQKSILPASKQYPIISALGEQLVSLRRKLLRSIDRRLVKTRQDSGTMVEDLTAFSLATSSTPSDTLRHLQRLRADAICQPLDGGKNRARESIPKRMHLFFDTIRETKAIFPEVFAAALKVLGARSLLDDSNVTSIDELGLDINQRWLPDDITNFVPYVRHDELNREKVGQLLASWSQQTSANLRDIVKDDVESISDLQTVVEVRRETFQLWLSSRRTLSASDSTELFTGLRIPFLVRVKKLMNNACINLQSSVSSSIFDIIDEWQAGVTPRQAHGLWDLSAYPLDLSDGAQSFRDAIIERRSGKEIATVRVFRSYNSSIAVLHQLDAALKAMRDTRWDDDYNDYDDEDTNNSKSSEILSRSDPQELQAEMRTTVVWSIKQLEFSLTSRLNGPQLDCSRPSSSGIFLFRTLRQLRQQLPALVQTTEMEWSAPPFCEELVGKLQANLATTLLQKTKPILRNQYVRFAASRYQISSLWSGTPALPSQPIPATFSYLRTLTKEMEALGQDLWSPDTVSRVRDDQARAVAAACLRFVEALEKRAAALQARFHTRVKKQQAVANGETHAEENGVSEETIEDLDHQDTKSSVEPRSNIDIVDDDITKAVQQEDAQNHSADTVGAVEEHPEDVPPPPTISNNHVKDESTPTITYTPPPSLQAQAKLTQLLFDVLYLSEALSPTSTTPSQDTSSTSSDGESHHTGASSAENPSLQEVATLLAEKGEIDSVAVARVRKAAKEYWRRTYLLFGLLAV